MSTPQQIQKQLAREKAHAARMAAPNGFVIYKYSFREMKRLYVKSINESADESFFDGGGLFPGSFVDEVQYTENKSEALVHRTYDAARWDVAGRDHLEYVTIGEHFHIEKA